MPLPASLGAPSRSLRVTLRIRWTSPLANSLSSIFFPNSRASAGSRMSSKISEQCPQSQSHAMHSRVSSTFRLSQELVRFRPFLVHSAQDFLTGTFAAAVLPAMNAPPGRPRWRSTGSLSRVSCWPAGSLPGRRSMNEDGAEASTRANGSRLEKPPRPITRGRCWHLLFLAAGALGIPLIWAQPRVLQAGEDPAHDPRDTSTRR